MNEWNRKKAKVTCDRNMKNFCDIWHWWKTKRNSLFKHLVRMFYYAVTSTSFHRGFTIYYVYTGENRRDMFVYSKISFVHTRYWICERANVQWLFKIHEDMVYESTCTFSTDTHALCNIFRCSLKEICQKKVPYNLQEMLYAMPSIRKKWRSAQIALGCSVCSIHRFPVEHLNHTQKWNEWKNINLVFSR